MLKFEKKKKKKSAEFPSMFSANFKHVFMQLLLEKSLNFTLAGFKTITPIFLITGIMKINAKTMS